jgi:hypothetical protein
MAKNRNLGNLSDVLTAGSTYATGTTPPALDSSQNLATTQFVDQNTGHGNCRLSVTSTTVLTLNPYSGNRLNINGQTYHIPSGGVTLSNSGLSASTCYYVYAYISSGNITLEAVTTTHATNTTTGIEQKSGDATRTLVGMIATNASGQFVDSPTQRFCVNWFNRRGINGYAVVGAVAVSSTTAIEATAGARITFISWADEAVVGILNGEVVSTTASGNALNAGLYLDGNQLGAFTSCTWAGVSLGNGYASSGITLVTELAVHTTTMYAATSASAMNVSTNNNILIRG